MASPTPRSVRHDPILQNLVRQYRTQQSHYIATQVFPVLDTGGGQTGTYQYIPRGAFVRPEDTSRAPNTESKGGGFEFKTGTFSTHREAWHKDLDDETIASANMPVGPEEAATNYVSDVLLTVRERDFATNVLKTGVWGRDVNVGAAATDQWNNAMSDPSEQVQDEIETMLERTGFEPNTLVVGYKVYRALRDHPDLLSRRGTASETIGFATLAQIAEWLGVQRIVVSKSSYNTAKEGVADNFAFSFGDNVLLCYTPQAGSQGDGVPAAGYTFNWNDIAPMEDVPTVDRFYMELKKSWRIEGEMYYGFQTVAVDLGVLFQNVLT